MAAEGRRQFQPLEAGLARIEGRIGPGGIELDGGEAHRDVRCRALRRDLGIAVDGDVAIGILERGAILDLCDLQVGRALAGTEALRSDPLTHFSLNEEVVDDRFDALLHLAPDITVSGELPEQGLLE